VEVCRGSIAEQKLILRHNGVLLGLKGTMVGDLLGEEGHGEGVEFEEQVSYGGHAEKGHG
jgi:hypothetical protein